MRTSSVKINELNEDNWYACCALEISESQTKHIELNAISIAQSKFEISLKPFAIYYEEKVVGFFMYNTVREELDGYWVYRIMIDKNYQGRGIGKAATQLMILEMSKLPNAKKILWVTIQRTKKPIIYMQA